MNIFFSSYIHIILTPVFFKDQIRNFSQIKIYQIIIKFTYLSLTNYIQNC